MPRHSLCSPSSAVSEIPSDRQSRWPLSATSSCCTKAPEFPRRPDAVNRRSMNILRAEMTVTNNLLSKIKKNLFLRPDLYGFIPSIHVTLKQHNPRQKCVTHFNSWTAIQWAGRTYVYKTVTKEAYRIDEQADDERVRGSEFAAKPRLQGENERHQDEAGCQRNAQQQPLSFQFH